MAWARQAMCESAFTSRSGSEAHWAAPQELKPKAGKGVLDSMSEWLIEPELEEELSCGGGV